MKALLVTGVAGFIGSNFARYYLEKYPGRRLIGLDALTYAGNLENLEGLPADRFIFVKGDITDAALVGSLVRTCDGVINFAAESHVDRSIHDPLSFMRTNVLGTGTLLEAARACWRQGGRWQPGVRFLQVSTDEVYGSLGKEGMFTEETPLDPHSPYSASKAGADILAGAYHDTYGMPVVITRCSNNYGPYQFPEKLIPLMIRNALAHQPLPVYGDGRQVRDWLHVEDHCRALDRALEDGVAGEVYNIGGCNERENIGIVRLVLSILEEETGDPGISPSLIRHVSDRPGHDRRYAIDASKIRGELGWQPGIPFDDGIRSTIRWYLDNRGWTERVVSGEYLAFYEKNYGSRSKGPLT